jgi:hypothetical protein
MKRASCLHKVLIGLEKDYLNLLLLTNSLSLYLYLFWDSLVKGMPALSGGPADPLFIKADRFMDWINTLHSAGLTRPYDLENQVAMPVYGPLTYVALKPLSIALNAMPSSIEISRILWLAITGIVLASVLRNVVTIRAALHPDGQSVSPLLLATALLLGYPFLFAFDRGNLELITFGLVSWFLALIIQRRKEHTPDIQRFLSISRSEFVLALAVCIKPYTLLFAICSSGHDPSDRRTQLRQAAGVITRILGLAIVPSILSMAILYQGDVALGYSELSHWQQEFRASYVIGTAGDKFFSSPYIAIKSIILWLSSPDWLLGVFVKVYPVVVLAYCSIAFLALTCIPCRRIPYRVGLIILLTAIIVTLMLFPFNANEYKAIYALLPFTIAYRGPETSSDALISQSPSGEGLIRAQSLAIALCFVLLVNRYGLLGIGTLASLLSSVAVALFPLLLFRTLSDESRINVS